MRRAFLDATCWIAWAIHPQGAMQSLLRMAELGYCHLLFTQAVIEEVLHVLSHPRYAEAKRYFERTFPTLDIELVRSPTEAEEATWAHATPDPHDRHVLAGAVLGGADVLISGDKKHLHTDAMKALYPLPVKTTTEFLRDLYSDMGYDW